MRRPGPGKTILIAAALAAVAVAAGCSPGQSFSSADGRALFIEKCGTCHQLAEAATTAQVGPDLDAAFAAARDSGMDDATIQGVVEGQIANPRGADPEDTHLYMPADLVTGQDAADVAYYVGQVAGVPGIEPPTAPGGLGGQVFAQNGCGSCHTLEGVPDASGSVGPNLTESLRGQDASAVEESIVDPEAQPTAGFPSGVMPSNYADQIPAKDLKALVEFLMEPGSR
jgi:mono/diheme cytochrome c family protein